MPGILIDKDEVVRQQVIVAGRILRFRNIDNLRQLFQAVYRAGNIELRVINLEIVEDREHFIYFHHRIEYFWQLNPAPMNF